MSDASLTTDSGSEPPARESPSLAMPSRSADARFFSRLAVVWTDCESRLAQLGEWFNPILVKETRQALVSWQFMLTFILLLVACWVVTIGGVALIGPSIYFSAGGGELLRAYVAILSLAMLVVVPFAAFRSLSVERDDNTYDLLSITTLRPRQIISGKLSSAVVQMVMYFSAITPCLAFTYLLRGVDAPTIALLLAYTFFASLGLSMAGLLLATLAFQRYSQLVLSVGFVAALLWTFVEAQDIVAELVRIGYALIGSREFWFQNMAGVILYGTTFALAYRSAAGMITFATENRSTPLRVLMLLQQAAFVGWMAFEWIAADFDTDVLTRMATIAGGYWFVMGTMLNGERAEMSHRVRRGLPQSALGRAFLTWFNPGPSSGFMFAFANVTSVILICAAAEVYARWQDPWNWSSDDVFCYLALTWSYVVAYLGLGRLVVSGLRLFTEVNMFSAVLLHVLLVLAGSGIPTSIQKMSLELQNAPYSYLQITNPFWTLSYIDRSWPVPEEPILLIVVPAAAIGMLLLNLPGLVYELRRVRVALPSRIAEDEAELHPVPAEGPKNPWDAP